MARSTRTTCTCCAVRVRRVLARAAQEGTALGFGKCAWKCGSATSVRVLCEALCLLLEHGVWVREPLSVRVLCERVPRAWEPLLARVRQLVSG